MDGKKIQITLPLHHDTPGALVFQTEKRLAEVPIGKIYVRKEYVDTIDGEWPTSATITVDLSK